MGLAPLHCIDDFLREEFLHTDSWWGDKLLGPQQRLLIGGRGGSKKSFLALGLSLALSSRTKTNYISFPISNNKKVLYMNFEINEASLQERLQAMTDGDELGEHSNLFITNSFDFKIDNADDRAHLFHEVVDMGMDLIVFDCLYKMHNKDEDSSTEMKIVCDYLDLFVKEGMSVILVHHHNKGNTDRGSTTITDWVDTVIGIKKETLYFNKVRNGVEPAKMKLEWGGDHIFKSKEPIIADAPAQKINDQLIVDILNSEGVTKMSQSAIGRKLEERGIVKSVSLRKYVHGHLLTSYKQGGKKFYKVV